MTMTPSIEFDLPSLDAKVPAFAFATSVVAAPPMQSDNGSAEVPVPTVEAFQTVLARPVAENAKLQHALEDIVGQLSRTAFATPVSSTDVAEVTRQAAASTVPVAEPATVVDRPAVVVPSVDVVSQKEIPLVDVASRRVEQPVVERPVVDQPAVVVPPVDVVPQKEIPLVDVAPRRVEGRAVLDETDLGEAIVAAGIRPVVDGMMPVAPQVVAAESGAVTAVDSVRAAFAPMEVLPAETFFEVANAVADVLLVSPGLLRGEGEMRVQLRPDVLEGSEIRIAVTGRQLAVEFFPQTSDVAVLIEQNRPQLEQHLAARFQTFALSVGVRRRHADEMRGSVG